MTEDEQDEHDEHQYDLGKRFAFLSVMRLCYGEMMDGKSIDPASYVIERTEAVQALRRLCEEHGDNNWPDNLNLSDVIEKHLGRHLQNH